MEAELGAHLPFVFEAVKDVEALEKILGAHNAVERGIILGRLVACHHIHLGAEKRAIQEVREKNFKGQRVPRLIYRLEPI